jgi:CBS domain-containing protein
MREEFPTLMERAYRIMKLRFVEDIMSKDVVTIAPDATMAEAAKVMGDMHIGSLIVVSNGKPVAIVTERDLLSKIIAKGQDPARVKVSDVMSSPLITIKPTASIKEAARAMIEKKGRLAVFIEDRLVGIVTASDLIKSLPEAPETEFRVEKVMTKRVTSVDESTTVAEAARIMGEQRIGSVIVNKEGRPYGIFTERDLLTTFLARGRSLETKVGDVASHPIITITPEVSVHETAKIMTAKHIRRLPVVDRGKIVGIVTARDLVEAYAK